MAFPKQETTQHSIHPVSVLEMPVCVDGSSNLTSIFAFYFVEGGTSTLLPFRLRCSQRPNLVMHSVFGRSAISLLMRKSGTGEVFQRCRQLHFFRIPEVCQRTEGSLKPRVLPRKASEWRLLRTEMTILRPGSQAGTSVRRRDRYLAKRNNKCSAGRCRLFGCRNGDCLGATTGFSSRQASE